MTDVHIVAGRGWSNIICKLQKSLGHSASTLILLRSVLALYRLVLSLQICITPFVAQIFFVAKLLQCVVLAGCIKVKFMVHNNCLI